MGLLRRQLVIIYEEHGAILSLVAKLEDNFEVMKMINDISKDLSTNNAYSPSTMTKFIQLCNFMRYTFIICDVHHSIESNIDKRICEQCEVTVD